jgi:hypothetical protein
MPTNYLNQYVISMDEVWGRDHLEIVRLNLIDFLLDQTILD